MPKSIAKNLKEPQPTSGAPGPQMKSVCHSRQQTLIALPHRLAVARTNVYDDAMEFWVVVREHGSHEESHEQEERCKSKEKLEAT